MVWTDSRSPCVLRWTLFFTGSLLDNLMTTAAEVQKASKPLFGLYMLYVRADPWGAPFS